MSQAVNTMKSNDIKIIALDLDGTCLKNDGNISERTKNALTLAGEKGITIVIATGRPLTGVPEEITDITGVNYIIALNGSRVYDNVRKETLFVQGIDENCLLEIAEIIKKHDVLADFFADNKGYCEKSAYERAEHYLDNKNFCEYYLKTRVPVGDLWDRQLCDYAPIEKINMFFGDLSEREKVKKALQKFTQIKVCSGMKNNLEINNYMVNKGDALIRLADTLKIDASNIMSFGDGGNDADMIKMAGIGVAMGNSSDSLKSEADYVTVSNEEDGVACVIEEFFK